jgi:hypothetical protein
MAIERLAACLLIFGCAGFWLVSATNEQSLKLLVQERPPAAITCNFEHVPMLQPLPYAF